MNCCRARVRARNLGSYKLVSNERESSAGTNFVLATSLGVGQGLRGLRRAALAFYVPARVFRSAIEAVWAEVTIRSPVRKKKVD